jgi:hypothetical protein
VADNIAYGGAGEIKPPREVSSAKACLLEKRAQNPAFIDMAHRIRQAHSLFILPFIRFLGGIDGWPMVPANTP